MDSQYHVLICKQAIGNKFSQKNLSVIIKANLHQDGMFTGLLGHPEYHYDGGDLSYGKQYLISQKKIILDNLKNQAETTNALQALGRFYHCAQDFYAHSNYVQLWKNLYGTKSIESIDKAIMESDELFVCRTYYPLEAITYYKVFRPFARKHLPDDSHANMNLDDPSRGDLFPIAMDAAIHRTKLELSLIEDLLNPHQFQLFTGK